MASLIVSVKYVPRNWLTDLISCSALNIPSAKGSVGFVQLRPTPESPCPCRTFRHFLPSPPFYSHFLLAPPPVLGCVRLISRVDAEHTIKGNEYLYLDLLLHPLITWELNLEERTAASFKGSPLTSELCQS